MLFSKRYRSLCCVACYKALIPSQLLTELRQRIRALSYARKQWKILFIFSDFCICNIFVELYQGAVIAPALSMIMEPLEHFLYAGGQKQRRSHSMSRIKSIVEIFNMQIDLKSGFKVSIKHALSAISPSRHTVP